MSIPRSDHLIVLCYFLAKHAEKRPGKKNSEPPHELQQLNFDTLADIYQYLFADYGDGREYETFRNSLGGHLQGYREYLNGKRDFSRNRHECELVHEYWGKNDLETRSRLWRSIRPLFG